MSAGYASTWFSSSGICRMLLLVCTLALAACDNGTPLVNTSANMPIVRIGRLICGGHLPLAVVERKYQDTLNGFTLNTVQNNDWNDVVRDLKSGKMEGVFMLSPLAMDLIRNGLPAKIVLESDHNGNGFVLSRKIASIEALRQHPSVIAVPHRYSQQRVLLHMILKQHGVPETMVGVIAMPPRDMINAMRRGEIDGFVVGEPESHRSIFLHEGWQAAISPQIWKGHLDHVFVATNRFIREHPEQLQSLVNALIHGGRFIEKHPHEAAVLGQDYTGAPAHVFEDVLSRPADWIEYKHMRPNTQDLRDMAVHMVEAGLWRSVPEDMESFADPRFVDHAMQDPTLASGR